MTSPDPSLSRRLAVQRAAGIAAAALAASLPWSTSATGILAGIWAVLAIAGTTRAEMREEIRHARSWLPVALVVLLVLSAAWSTATWKDVGQAIGGFAKLLAIPLLIVQFRRRPEDGRLLLASAAISVLVLLTASWALVINPDLVGPRTLFPGVVVKDYISQNVFLLLLAFGALIIAWQAAEARLWVSVASGVAIFAVTIANILSVQSARAALIAIAVLVVVVPIARLASWRSLAIGCLLAVATAGLLWSVSPQAQSRLQAVATEVQSYNTQGAATSSGYRLEWYRRSVEIIAANPLLGVGAGGVRSAMDAQIARTRGNPEFVTANPHNQLLWTMVQTGVLGGVLLLAMWLAHLLAMGRGHSISAFGWVIVVQNVFFSLFNSHLSDFTAGWIYVVMAGTVMGLCLAQAEPKQAVTPAASPADRGFPSAA